MSAIKVGMTQGQSVEVSSVTILGKATILAFFLWVLVAFGAVFLTTLGIDEATVLNGLKSLLQPWTPNVSNPPISTNGGLFALANISLEFLFGSKVWIHRLFSLGCMLALVGVLLFNWTGQQFKIAFRLLYVAPFLALPGTAEIGATALGTSTAFLLIILFSLVWTASERPSVGRVVLCGVLFGLSASSRFELVLIAPVLVAAECFRAYQEKLSYKIVAPALASITIGLVLFGANQIWSLSAIGPTATQNGLDAQQLTMGTGLRLFQLNYLTSGLNRVSREIGFFPPIMIFLSLAGFVWTAAYSAIDPIRVSTNRFKSLIFMAGIVLLMAWILRAPLPYLRYIWPSLACFAILLGQFLVQIFSRALEKKEWKKVMYCQAIALVLILTGVAGSMRNIVMGESDYMMWEWAGQMARDHFTEFQHARDQRAAFNYIKNELPPDSVLVSYLPYALRYETGRPTLEAAYDLPRIMPGKKYYLVLSPMVGPFFYLSPRTYSWIEANTLLLRQFGRYSIYEMKTLPPMGSDILEVAWKGYTGHPQSRSWNSEEDWQREAIEPSESLRHFQKKFSRSGGFLT